MKTNGMEKFSAMIPSSLRLDLEYIAAKYDTSISNVVRAFLTKCTNEALEILEGDGDLQSEMG